MVGVTQGLLSSTLSLKGDWGPAVPTDGGDVWPGSPHTEQEFGSVKDVLQLTTLIVAWMGNGVFADDPRLGHSHTQLGLSLIHI